MDDDVRDLDQPLSQVPAYLLTGLPCGVDEPLVR